MILIIGSHQDDVLYCSSLLNKKRNETVLGRFPASRGTIFNQETMVVSGIHTSLLSSAIVSHILGHDYVNLVFVLGKCYSLDDSFKRGDIVMSREIFDIDVDQIDVANATLFQVPGMPVFYKTQNDVLGYLSDGFHKRTMRTAASVSFLSSDNLSSPAVEKAMQLKQVLGNKGPFVIDSCSYGVALSCHLHGVPCVAVKAVERSLEDKKSIEGYLGALDSYVDIGKAVVYTIGDIGRSDVLRLRRSE